MSETPEPPDTKPPESTLLKGDLIDRINTVEPETGPPRGDLINKLGGVGSTGAEVEMPTQAITPGARIIQRDSGDSFEITDVKETRHGRRAILQGANGQKVTLGLDDLESKLATEDSPWHW